MRTDGLESGSGVGDPAARRAGPGRTGQGVSAAALLAHVRAALEALGVDPVRVAPGARLVEDLELDSLDWVDLAQRLEEALPVQVREERLASLPTVADLVALLRARLEVPTRRDAEAR